MSRRGVILLMGALGLLLGQAPAVVATPPLLVWNATASAPQGLYHLRPVGELQVGQLVAVRPPEDLADWLDRRGAAPRGVLLIKRVAAVAPAIICWSQGRVTRDGALVAIAQAKDREGRRLPGLAGCRRLEADEVFLLNDAPASLDGRYFGPLPRSAVTGEAAPIWIAEGPADAR